MTCFGILPTDWYAKYVEKMLLLGIATPFSYKKNAKCSGKETVIRHIAFGKAGPDLLFMPNTLQKSIQ